MNNMLPIENNHTPRSENFKVAVSKELLEFFVDVHRRYRDLRARECEMEQEEKHILLSKLSQAAPRFSGSESFSEIMRRLIRSVKEDDMKQAIEASSYMVAFVTAVLHLHSGKPQKEEEQAAAPGTQSRSGTGDARHAVPASGTADSKVKPRRIVRMTAIPSSGACVDNEGNTNTASLPRLVRGKDIRVRLSADQLDRFSPETLQIYMGVPIARQKVGWHIVDLGDELDKEIVATLEELVRPGMQDKLTSLVAAAERCEELHISHSAEAMIARTSRSTCCHDIRHVARELSRYITDGFMLTSSQTASVTQAHDLLSAAVNALADGRFADAVTRVKEARKEFTEIWDGSAEQQAGEK